jgi:hypothetical protein
VLTIEPEVDSQEKKKKEKKKKRKKKKVVLITLFSANTSVLRFFIAYVQVKFPFMHFDTRFHSIICIEQKDQSLAPTWN